MSRLLCLASSSKSRSELLSQVKLNFIVNSVEIDETKLLETPLEYVKRLSKMKVTAVYEKYKDVIDFNPDVLVGADSVAIIKNQVIGKPKDKGEASKIIKLLSGETHEFLTGYYILDFKTLNSISEVERTLVKIETLDDDEIELYVNNVKPYSWAGGYSTFRSSYLIERIEGSISNLQGLPMHSLKRGIENLKYNWFDFII